MMLVTNPLPDQLLMIRTAAIAGAGLGVLYDIFRMLRWHKRSRWLELVLDFLFSAVSAGVFFVLATAVTQLQLRGFLLLSFAAGWVLWNLLPGRWFRFFLSKTQVIMYHMWDIFSIRIHHCRVEQKKSAYFHKKQEKTKKKSSLF